MNNLQFVKIGFDLSLAAGKFDLVVVLSLCYFFLKLLADVLPLVDFCLVDLFLSF
jgi:hypothetical protein